MPKRPIILFALLLQVVLLHASHIVGGYMRYGWDHATTWNIQLVLYRDCYTGVPPFDMPAHCALYRMEPNGPVRVDTFEVMPEIYTDTIVNIASPACNTTSNACVHKGYYNFQVDLPADNYSYIIAYQRCCRNGARNLLDPLSIAGYTIYAEITPIARQLHNNAVDWRAEPPVLACAHVPTTLPLTAYDADGDSLVYRFCEALTGGSDSVSMPIIIPPPPYDPVVWAPGYQYDLPLGPGSVSMLNAQTGEWYLTCHLLGIYVYSVCVSEYRNGVLLNIVRRDAELFVVDYTAASEPFADGFSVFPNPSSDWVTIVFSKNKGFGAPPEIRPVWVYDNLGNMVKKTSPSLQFDGSLSFKINDLPAGVYQCLLQTEDGIKRFQVVRE
ncbi:MAG: T9SS type A sorting domain-containing protein [Bacteroidota bacterium]